MTPFSIRAAQDSDHEQIRLLAPELTAGMPAWRSADRQRTAVAGWVDDALTAARTNDAAVLVALPTASLAEPCPTVLGFVSVTERLHFTGERQGYVGELVVAQLHRRAGVAATLMAAAEDWARRRGLASLSLETGAGNAAARAMYAGLGYAEEEVTLTKRLPPLAVDSRRR